MKVTLLGTGSPEGIPVNGCTCRTCRSARKHDRSRTRFSVHVYNERTDEALLVDASPDFRRQFETNDVPLPDAVVVTHFHYDHHSGLGDACQVFESLPVHAANGARTTVPAPNLGGRGVADALRTWYDYADFAVAGHPPFAPFEVCGFEVTLAPVNHGGTACYGVTVQELDGDSKLTLTSDTNYAIPDDSLAVFEDPDLLVANGSVPAAVCGEPSGLDDRRTAGFEGAEARHPGEDGVPRSAGDGHLTKAGALALGTDLDATETRVSHVSHYYPPEEAFSDPLAADGERHVL